MFRIINLHNSNRQLTALKGLKEIYETIDLGRIQRGLMVDTNEAFNVACDVMSVILLNIDPIKVKDDSQDGDSDDENGDSQEGNGSGGSNTLTDEELQDMIDSDSIGSSTTPDENLGNDDGSDSVELSPRQKQMLDKHFEKQEKFLDGDVQKTKLNKKYFASFSEVQKAQKGKGQQCLIDARPAAFFTGDKKHAKARIPGRLANARNLQEGNLIDGGFKIKSSSEIKSQFGGLEGVEKYKGYISYCNTGHWAATVWFGLSEIAQIPNVKMYDGGMTHWTYDPKRKVDLS